MVPLILADAYLAELSDRELIRELDQAEVESWQAERILDEMAERQVIF